jgi:hypothetical protein
MVFQSFRQLLMAGGMLFLFLAPVSAETGNSGSYRYLAELADFKKGEMKRYDISPVHPYAFELKTLQNSMWVLAYQNRVIGWSKKKHVFDPNAVKAIGPQLVGLFRKAGKNQRVIFKVQKASGKILFKGDVFLTPEGLNWRVTHFKGSRKKVDDFSVLGDSERLVPLEGHVYKTKEAHEGLKQDITNWVIFSSVAPEKNRILPEITSGDNRDRPSAEAITGKVKKRLKVLESLKRDGVISDLEYQKRREEILKSF